MSQVKTAWVVTLSNGASVLVWAYSDADAEKQGEARCLLGQYVKRVEPAENT